MAVSSRAGTGTIQLGLKQGTQVERWWLRSSYLHFKAGEWGLLTKDIYILQHSRGHLTCLGESGSGHMKPDNFEDIVEPSSIAPWCSCATLLPASLPAEKDQGHRFGGAVVWRIWSEPKLLLTEHGNCKEEKRDQLGKCTDLR